VAAGRWLVRERFGGAFDRTVDLPAAIVPDAAAATVEDARKGGADEATLAALDAQMASFKLWYANPLFRLPMTFAEIFPVGVLVSLLSALVLRKPRALPSR